MKKSLIFATFCLLLGIAVAVTFLLPGNKQSLDESAPLRDLNRDLKPKITSVNCAFDIPTQYSIDCFHLKPDGSFSNTELPVVVIGKDNFENKEALIYLQGGPGVGQITAEPSVLRWLDWMGDAGAARPLVLFDTRGNPPSNPDWQCEAYHHFSVALLQQDLNVQQEQQQGQEALAKCFKKAEEDFGLDFLSQFSSRQNAADAYALMSLLGYESFHVYASSYGTRVAQLLAFDYSGVKSMILDSPDHFSREPANVASQPETQSDLHTAFSGLFDVYFLQPRNFLQDPVSLELVFWRILKRLDDRPLELIFKIRGESETLLLNDEFAVAVLYSSIYEESQYSKIIEALLAADKGRFEPLSALVQAYLDRQFSQENRDLVFFATQCNDRINVVDGDSSVDQNERENDQNERESDDEGSDDPWSAYTLKAEAYDICQYPAFKAASFNYSHSVNVPVTILSGELDPVTPLADAVALALHFESKEFLLAEGKAHGVSRDGSCGYDLFEEFFQSQKLQKNEYSECKKKSLGELVNYLK